MTKTINVGELQKQIQDLLSSTRGGDEVIIEKDGKPIAKITPIISNNQIQPKQRIFGLGKGTVWMSEDFDDELPDEFWGFDKEL